MEDKDTLKKQLQSLKRELKGWETMFERKHGHKPSKEDIEKCPAEIRETYREYKKVKCQLSGETEEEKKKKRVSFSENPEYHQSAPPPAAVERGVFGLSLNKKPKEKTEKNGHEDKGERNGGERKSVWKLRRWNKSRGYHTVVVNGDDEGNGDKKANEGTSTESAESEMHTDKERKKVSVQVEYDLKTELEQLSQAVSFKDLTEPSHSPRRQRHNYQPLLPDNTLDEDGENKTEDFEEETVVVPVAGQCSNRLHFFNMSSGSPSKTHGVGGLGRIKRSRVVSQNWLDRCKPDLAEFEPAGEQRLTSGEEDEVYKEEEEGDNDDEEEEEELNDVRDEEDLEMDEFGENDSLNEEEEERQEAEEVEEEVETENVSEDGLRDHNGEPSLPTFLPIDDLSTFSERNGFDGSRGFSWDDNDEVNSDSDSSSEDDPVVNSCIDHQFEKKWVELSNSVKTLSPLKQLPTLPSKNPSLTPFSKSPKKKLVLAPRTETLLGGDISSSSCSASTEGDKSSSEKTGMSHLRDSMTLLELYSCKNEQAATQTGTQSLVHKLSNSADSATSCRSNRRHGDKGTSLWKLLPSERAKNFVDTDTLSSSSAQTNPDTLNSLNHSSPVNSSRMSASCELLLPSSSQVHDSIPTGEESYPPSLNSNIVSDLVPATLDSDDAVRMKQMCVEADRTMNLESDMDLLSQDSHVTHANRLSVTTKERSLRGVRGKVHSAAAVISEVEVVEKEQAVDPNRLSKTAEQSVKTNINHFDCDSRAAVVKEKETHYVKDRLTSSTEPTLTSNDRMTKNDSSAGETGSRQVGGSGRGGGKAVSDNFIRLNMKVKKFSRRPGRFLTGSAYKRQMWKKRQNQEMGGAKRGGRTTRRNVCFKCGKPGHWAKNCTDNGGSTNLGKFAGEMVKFNDDLILEREDNMDPAMLDELAKNSPFPTVHEAAMMARGIKVHPPTTAAATTGPSEVKGQDKDHDRGGDETRDGGRLDSYVAPPPCHAHSTPPPPSVEPLFPLSENGDITSTPKCVVDTLRKFGHSSFRPGQEEAVMNILSGVSTLVIHSTGSGKSLCYQLPAYLYAQSRSPCIALVISPLVSLMEDQVRHFPPGLKGACLHTNQTRPQREKVLCDVVEGRINVLLLSPEALVGGAFWSGRDSSYSLKRLPPVAFACIDEVHCVSEWSHNFRPSYLRIQKVLRGRLGVHCVLGLTATATHTTALSVASHLGINQRNIIRGTVLPDNLHISVSCDQDKDQALVELLQSSKFRDCESIIVYCTRQQQTERVAQLLRTCLQSFPAAGIGMEEQECDPPDDIANPSKGKSRKRKSTTSTSHAAKRRKKDWSADSYHAGMAASQRKRVQNDFMSGRVRIVVATVAFGMGLNKADVRAIIHYNMPKSFESFVQEIGRAGRDGQPAFCHVFIDKEGSDLCELRRHAYSNTVDPYTVKQLVGKAFLTCHCREQKQTQQPLSEIPPPVLPTDFTQSPPSLSSPRWCAGHEVAIPIEAMVERLDVKEECISTLLCYLELQGWLEVLNVVNDSCTLKCYGGARQLRALAQKVPAVAAAAARLREKGTDLDHTGEMIFSVIEVANSMGWESHIVRSELSSLQYNDRGTGGQGSTNGARSTVLVEFSDLAFHVRSPGDLSPDERDHVCEFLSKKVKGQEEREVEKLHLLHAVLQSISQRSYFECERIVDSDAIAEIDSQRDGSTLRKMICRYFSSEGLDTTFLAKQDIPVLPVLQEITPKQEQRVRSDIHSLVGIHSDQQFTGRTVARIFHGIASPLFPAEVWGRQHRFWRRHLEVDFNLLCQLATKKLLELR